LAADCAAVVAVMRRRQTELAALCESSPCESACRHAAACVKAECTGFAQYPVEAIEAECLNDCDEENVEFILRTECADLVDLLGSDPTFAATCHGTSQCAPQDRCSAYADKVGDCAVGHCGTHAAPYRDAIVAVLYAYCARAEDCPPEAAVTFVLSPDVACDDEPLSDVGRAEPFTAICEGMVGATMEQLRASCERLVACGAEFESLDECAGLLAIGGETATKVACIGAAPQCAEVFGCL
jgi:hypothetical protein